MSTRISTKGPGWKHLFVDGICDTTDSAQQILTQNIRTGQNVNIGQKVRIQIKDRKSLSFINL